MSESHKFALLYVDDDADIRRIVQLAISLDQDMDLRVAAGGEEAIALLDGESWRPDVVLLDMMMPKMSGTAVMQALRTKYGLDEAPFIFITAMGRQTDVANYREQGVAGVIVKPFDPITLAQRVREIVGR